MKTNTTISAFTAVAMAFVLIVIFPTVISFLDHQSGYSITFLIVFRLAIFFMVFHIIGYWFYRMLGTSENVENKMQPSVAYDLPQVAVLLPVRDEPEYLVRRMFLHLNHIQYSSLSVIMIDNSTLSKTNTFTKMAKEIGLSVKIIRKPDFIGFKAGALNKAMAILETNIKYVLILDIDHAPQPDILQRMVPILEEDRSVAFIQAPQRYEETSTSSVKGAYCYRQRIFYDHICRGLSSSGSLFMSGTNTLIRKTALNEVSGFDESSLTEDIRTSVKLHQRKWIGKYFPETVALGLPPADLKTYHRQQRRWAIGTYQNLFFVLCLLFRKPQSLTPAQLLLYLGWNGTYYLQGFAGLILIAASIAFLFLDIYRYLLWTDTLVFFIFLVTILSTMSHERQERGVRWSKLLIYKAIMFGDSIIHATAFLDFICSRKLIFEVTRKIISPNSGTSTGFVLYHGFVTFFIGMAIIIYLLSSPINILVTIWPSIFMSQAITILFVASTDSKVSDI